MRKRTLKTASAILIGITLVWTIIASNCTNRNGSNEMQVKVGTILPLTGPAASLGKWIRSGYEIATEEINQGQFVPGVQINMLYEDGMSDPRNSVSAFTKLTSTNDVRIITTTLSPVSLAILPIVKEKNLILFAAAAHPAITGEYEGAFRHNLTVQAEVDILASYMAENVKPTHPRLIHLNDDYGISFNNYWLTRTSGVQSLPAISFDRNIQDLRPIALQALKDSPDCLILVGYGPPLGTLLRRIRESGFTGNILVNNAMPFPDVREAAGDAASGVYYVDYDIDRNDPAYIRINDKYRTRYGSDIPPVALFEHNTLVLIAKAYKETGGHVDQFPSYLRSQGTLSLPGEIVTFTKAGDIIPKLRMNKIQ